MQHQDIWRGVDLLAQKHGLSVSRLAKRAGLDATAFNRSKRISKDGRLRWPSTESLSRALAAVNERFSDFAGLIDGNGGTAVPLLEIDVATDPANFDATGAPRSETWEVVRLPGTEVGEALFALEVTGRDLEPVYRSGDRLIVSTKTAMRSGDRSVLMTKANEIHIGTVGRLTDNQVTLLPLRSNTPASLHILSDLVWIGRILWVSQ
ncbi:MAG: helix-turn-helix transcriptional regulator [Pseudomonadota bacterium]